MCNIQPFKSQLILSLFPCLALVFILLPFDSHLIGEDHGAHRDHNIDHSQAMRFDPISGNGANIGGFIFPELFVNSTGGLFEPGTTPADLASTEHDPQREAGLQAIELHLDLDFNGVLTGGIYGTGIPGEDEWEAALEESFLHYHLTDRIAIGGGQFLNRFGFQADQHLHAWSFVNQNLVNSRMLNEGELITQGGEAIIHFAEDHGVLTLGAGGVRTHGHEEEEGDEEGHDHLEVDNANLNNWMATADFRYQLPFHESARISASAAFGENGFGRHSFLFGTGMEKTWSNHGHDDHEEEHGHDEQFGSGSLMLRAEFIGRQTGVADEDGDRFETIDTGVSTALFYALNDRTTLSLRHDWVSELEALELEERHRISPAITTFLDRNQRIQARLQYDYNHSDFFGSDHSVWLQFQARWGGGGHLH